MRRCYSIPYVDFGAPLSARSYRLAVIGSQLSARLSRLRSSPR